MQLLHTKRKNIVQCYYNNNSCRNDLNNKDVYANNLAFVFYVASFQLLHVNNSIQGMVRSSPHETSDIKMYDFFELLQLNGIKLFLHR